MDYEELAAELLQKMYLFRRTKPPQKIIGFMRGEVLMLQCIAQHGGDVLPSEISQEMEISSARVAAALNSLEHKGLITREIDQSDRRRILVKLTPAGRKSTEEHQKAVIADTADMLSLLGTEDAKELVRITGKLAEMIPKNNGPP